MLKRPFPDIQNSEDSPLEPYKPLQYGLRDHPMIFRRILPALLLAFAFHSASGADDAARTQVPIQIESRETSKEGNLAVARGDVVIGVGETTIYCDYAQCDMVTRDVLVVGDVRIFRGEKIFSGDRAIYNIDTKSITGFEFRTASGPFLAQAHLFVSTSPGAFEADRGLFTTDNTSDPGYHLRARKVRIFKNDHTEYENVTVYVGRTPVFWLPYLYQPSKSDQSFSIAPGSNSTWGPFLLTRVAFPVSDNTYGGLRLDYMAKKGAGLGVDLTQEEKKTGGWGRFRAYYTDDKAPGTKDLGSANEQVNPTRFRVSLQDRTYFSETVYTSVNFNRLSDINFYRDFLPAEMRTDPNPDSVFAITKKGENYAVNVEVRKQFNKDFESAESLPALALDLKRQPFLDSGVFYDGETSVAKFRRNFLKQQALFEYANYDMVRLDSFHQLTYPKVLGGWLSVMPRVGVRGTHDDSSVSAPRLVPGDPLYASGGSLDRLVVNAGLEGSFKLSREFNGVENRAWGLDGLRHIIQPFANLSWVSSSRNPAEILPMDALSGSSKLLAIDFPQFNTIDSISSWDVLRMGVRNRLQTRRDQQTLNWVELESFIDLRLQQPDYASIKTADGGRYSNLFNRLKWEPLPWATVNFESQLPVLDKGFTELNTSTNLQATKDLTFLVGNRYIRGNKYFNDSDLVTGGARWRMSDNWAFRFEESYEVVTRQMEYQSYSVDRDLRSWMASFSVVFRERIPRNETAVLLTLILKDIPSVRLPLHVDPQAASSSGSSKNH